MSVLFTDFNKVSPEAWKQKIQVDLKGADYNDTLLWETEEGIVIKPFYTEEDRTYQEINLPKKGFLICQSVFVDDEVIANSIAINAIQRGATAIQFTTNTQFDIEKLLKGIDTNVTLYFQCNFLSSKFISSLSNSTKNQNVFFQLDVLGNLAQTGNWFSNHKSDFDEVEKIIHQTENSICIDATLYQNSGANRTQQLAYALAQTNEYVEQFGAEIISKLHFKFAVGSSYFMEISKLRAFRVLLKPLLEKHGVQEFNAHIFCVPSKRNKTLYDYNVNMLRTTSESMSAILGGVNTVANLSYDSIYNKSNEFGDRIARNQLLILQQESYLNECQEIANGTYFIENITHQLAEKALLIFKQIEKGGGFLNQLKKGTIQSKIKESSDKELNSYTKKDLVLLGTNRLPNEKDKMKGSIELYPFVKKKSIKTLIPPIIEKRLAEKDEQERLNLE